MKQKQKGSGLIFAVVLLFVILGMVITLSSITVLETKMSQKTKSSVGAFYNSESGVEWALNQIATKSGSDYLSTISGFSGNVASCPSGIGDCKIYFLDSSGKIMDGTNDAGLSETIADIKAVRSVGTQGGETQRAIEAAVASSGPKYTSDPTSISNGNNATFTHDLGYIPNCLWTSNSANQLISVKTISSTTIILQSATLGASVNVVVYCW